MDRGAPLKLQGRLGALTEREFRFLFSSSTISALGDGVAIIALAFAVLDVSGSATDLGLVLAARQIANAALVLAGGVWADRLPRQYVLIGAAVVQGAAQALTAALLVSGGATIPLLIALQAAYGAADGFVIPATTGLVPQTISAERLQQGNALMGLSRNVMGIAGPALGGVLVAAGSPAIALGFDAGTFAVAAILLVGLRLPARAGERERKSFLRELRDGWDEFTGHTWLWTTVLFFGLGNFVFASYFVLGPLIAKQELGGAAAWAALGTAFGIGSVGGGLLALRIRARRPLLVSCIAPAPMFLPLVGLAFAWPVPLLAAFSFVSGIGLAVHLTFWFTVFQQEIPAEAVSRVTSYDALGSFVLIPLGSALTGPVADVIGAKATLLGAAAINVSCIAIIVCIPSVWAIRRDRPPPTEATTVVAEDLP